MREIVALVEHYLREWDSSGWASAYHSLVELGPPVLPELEKRLATSRDGTFRAALVELARQLRSEEALPLFEAALRDPSPEVWKAALDGLVALASPASLLLLEEAAERKPPGRTDPPEWDESDGASRGPRGQRDNAGGRRVRIRAPAPQLIRALAGQKQE